ncbi:hypothetical protein R3P38DRAFT_3182740 [Favolaschia claudopus]|uniref:Uncharacterized protein n=1 Tax=Favolaschia claudopus TaxID=2862362 RepID=A0AAW0CI88_9AGAR
MLDVNCKISSDSSSVLVFSPISAAFAYPAQPQLLPTHYRHLRLTETQAHDLTLSYTNSPAADSPGFPRCRRRRVHVTRQNDSPGYRTSPFGAFRSPPSYIQEASPNMVPIVEARHVPPQTCMASSTRPSPRRISPAHACTLTAPCVVSPPLPLKQSRHRNPIPIPPTTVDLLERVDPPLLFSGPLSLDFMHLYHKYLHPSSPAWGSTGLPREYDHDGSSTLSGGVHAGHRACAVIVVVRRTFAIGVIEDSRLREGTRLVFLRRPSLESGSGGRVLSASRGSRRVRLHYMPRWSSSLADSQTGSGWRVEGGGYGWGDGVEVRLQRRLAACRLTLTYLYPRPFVVWILR